LSSILSSEINSISYTHICLSSILHKTRVCPKLKSSLASNNGEVNSHAFYMDNQNEENEWIFALKEKRNLCLKKLRLSE